MHEESNAEKNREVVSGTRWENSPYAYTLIIYGVKPALLFFLGLVFGLVIYSPLLMVIFGVGPVWESLVGTAQMFGDFGGFVVADFGGNPWKYLFGFGALYALTHVFVQVRYNAPERRIVPRYMVLALLSLSGLLFTGVFVALKMGESLGLVLPVVGEPSAFVVGGLLFVVSLLVSRGLHNTIVEDEEVYLHNVPVVIVWRVTARMGLLYMVFVGLFGLPGVFASSLGYASLGVTSFVALVYVIQRVVRGVLAVGESVEREETGGATESVSEKKSRGGRSKSIADIEREIIEEQGDDGFR